ncbi:hypothetical protein PGIGA_G00059930 [Pangasianodon gigas]|uniref:Uncharacterized protein n=1 Tax=Pangasianodon gigas TaxID=30993 RepID=A0ACC5X4S0_PANGG|nr:hypothetical protein [Pangasianodon gigas]
MTDQAFVTLATNDSYAKGAMVLGVCLRNHKTSRNLAVLIGDDVSQPCRSVLSQIFDEVCEVSVLDSGDAARLAMMKRPELGVTFTKLHCWSLTHYSKCVFMDADTLVLCNIDELFEREELSAAPDPGWPDCFNTGVFVFQPSKETYTRSVLSQIFDEVCEVSVLDSGDAARLAMMKRPELGVTFTKLHCWSLTHYSKCVFMDADTLVLCNIDELFEREELSAAPDPGWPDCFNTGVFVFQPSKETYTRLLIACTEHGSFDGGDQGVLNSYFSDWATADIAKHLPFIYNLSSVSIYTYLPAFRHFGCNAKVIHFLGERKPWDYEHGDDDGEDEECSSESEQCRSSSLDPDYFQQWWSVFKSSVLPLLSEEHTHPLSDSPSMEQEGVYVEAARVEECVHPPAPQTSSQDRKQKWEQGDADYLGEDSFTHIERKLDSFLK